MPLNFRGCSPHLHYITYCGTYTLIFWEVLSPPRISTVESRYLKVDWTIFYKFKLRKVQINLLFR